MAYIGRTPTGSILTSADIADGSISTAKLADSAVTTAKITNDAVDNTKLDLADTYAFTGTVSGAGALKKISSQSPSGVTSVEFTSGIDSTYEIYLFKFINIHPQTDFTHLYFNASTDGGSNYNVAKTTSSFRAIHDESDATASLSYRTGTDSAQDTGDIFVFDGVGNGSDESASGEFWLYKPSSTTYVKHMMWNFNWYQKDSVTMQIFNGGYCNTTSAINAVRFNWSSGNIDDGKVILYGVET
jgi:hypothetical protein